MKNFKGILVIGEKNIFGELSQIVDIAAQTNKLVAEMFKMNYNRKDLTPALHAVQTLERKSDVIAFKVSEDITSGAISPNVIDTLLESVQTADDIVDTFYYIARELNRMASAYSSGLELRHADWDSVYENMLALADKSLSKLKEALSSSDINRIVELRKEIESLEEQGDDVKDQGFDKLYGLTVKIHYLEFYHFQELLHKCDDVLDLCEDLSDLLVSTVTSILK